MSYYVDCAKDRIWRRGTISVKAWIYLRTNHPLKTRPLLENEFRYFERNKVKYMSINNYRSTYKSLFVKEDIEFEK